MSTIEWEHVKKKDGEDRGGNDELSVSISEGEFVILLGPSGEWTSTILRVLTALNLAGLH